MPTSELAAAETLLEAKVLLENRELDSALQKFYEAESQGADACMAAAGRWGCWMLKGEFERAWKESDRIRALQSNDPHRFWNGEALEHQHIMLRCLHGFGDAIQFLRYGPEMAKIAQSITLQVAPGLLPLFSETSGSEISGHKPPWANAVITWQEQEPFWNMQIECMELPYLFRTTVKTIPPPLSCLPFVQSHKKDNLLHVGLVWNAGEWNPSRSIPIAELKSLLPTKDVAFHNLQGGAAWKEWSLVSEECRIRTPSIPDGIVNLLAAVSRMDLIITVDTLAAHLGGTLGKPVWLLLQHAADWRWMIERKDSPWYPSITIFRRGRTESWRSLIQHVQSSLEDLLPGKIKRG